ncbi:MAG TPA: L,D-transpeptidase [Planctomycetes bacterium]|nr:L,D-transpeptidase [Planctomycetota bacterium]
MVKRLLFILVLAGLLWGGYRYYWKPSRGKTQDPAKIVDAATKAKEDAKSEQPKILEEEGSEKPSLSEELLRGEGDLPKVVSSDRSKYPLGSADRFAFEVLLEIGRKGAPESDLKASAKRFWEAHSDQKAAAQVLRSFELLRDAGRLDGAVAALGGGNGILEAKGAKDALRLFLDKVKPLSRERQVFLLSGLLDALTHGPKVWERIGGFVEEAYLVEQKALEGLLFRPGGKWHSVQRTVKKNGTLDGIAQEIERTFDIPMSPGILQMVNRIPDPRKLRWKQVIRVPIDPIRVVVEKRSFALKVFLGDALFRIYPVGLGMEGKTPVARFEVVEKEQNPRWVDPESGKLWAGNDPGNPLGGYFIKLKHPEFQGFGLHGTIDPSSIGKESSRGCVRLGKEAIQELFLYLPRRTIVQVVE